MWVSLWRVTYGEDPPPEQETHLKANQIQQTSGEAMLLACLPSLLASECICAVASGFLLLELRFSVFPCGLKTRDSSPGL